MDFTESIKQFSERVSMLKDTVSTEEATKMSLVVPLFQLLGYDVFNPSEFCPEYIADVGIKKGEKVVTSGLGTYNIPNIPVGTVLSVTEKSDHLTKEVFVKPSADLSDIRVVTLVGN